MPRYVSHEQARRFYDRIGRGQDARPVSERRALDALAAQGDFGRAAAVVEFGCGTGRFAARLLRERLPDGATYLGVDVSPRMVALAGAALAPWPDRARVVLTDGDVRLPAARRLRRPRAEHLRARPAEPGGRGDVRRRGAPGAAPRRGARAREPGPGAHAAGAPGHPAVARPLDA